MNTLTNEIQAAKIKHGIVAAAALTVDLFDGRTVTVPLVSYPRLLYGTIEARTNW